jgi:hypothetical protein
MTIEILTSGEINVNKLTREELNVLVDLRLNYYKQELLKEVQGEGK